MRVRSLVDQGARARLSGASLFVLGGVLYGVQCLYHWGQLHGVSLPEPWNLIFVAGITVVFLIGLSVISWRDRNRPSGGVVGRALAGIFAGAGLANLAMVFVFALNAAREHSAFVWMLYPPVIFALQGACWIAVWQVQKRGWHALVGFGWLLTAAAMGWFVRNTEAYVLIAAAALFVLMALPGWVLMRQARTEA